MPSLVLTVFISWSPLSWSLWTEGFVAGSDVTMSRLSSSRAFWACPEARALYQPTDTDGGCDTRASVQREHHDRRRPRAAEKARHDARGRRHVLLAAKLVSQHAAADRPAGIEAVERLAVAGVEHEEVVVEIAGEEHATGRRGDRRDERRRPLLFPAHLASRTIDGRQPTSRLILRIRHHVAAVIVRVWRELGLVRRSGERSAPVDGRHIEG